MEIMRIYTIEDGVVTDGSVVEKFTIRGAGITIPAIIVGEEGRGRQLGILPVHLPDPLYAQWNEKGSVKIVAAALSSTKSGRPKLIAHPIEDVNTNEKCLVVFRTPIGFRGGNQHTGDRVGVYCQTCGAEFDFLEKSSDKCPKCGFYSLTFRYAPFPGDVLVSGVIAQGAAGRMGSGEQLVAVIPKGVVFRTGYSGRRYGRPYAHYYVYDGQRIISATWDERKIADLF